MKTTMKRLAAYLLAILLVIQIMPAIAGETYTATFTPGYVKYREILEITQVEETSILTEDMTNQLNVTAGYANVVWSSDNETVATVDQTGLVTANAPGQVRITVEAEGYSDSITFRVVAKPQAEKTEKNDSEPAEKIIIIINGEKTKVEYDGQVHVNTYTATSNSDSFDAAKLKLTDAGKAHLGSGTDCGTYTDTLTADDFIYEGVEAEIVISKGWIQIKPKSITIKADNKTAMEGTTPDYSATAIGLLEGETIDLSQMQYKLSVQEGQTFIDPEVEEGQIIGNYKVEKVASGLLTYWTEKPLYNIAKISGLYYRLAKTQIWTAKDPVKDPAGSLNDDEYKVDKYDFKNVTIRLNDKEYIYSCDENAEQIAGGANYYEVKGGAVSIVKKKIGGGAGWLVPEGERYTDKNETDSIHRDYEITLRDAPVTVEQDVYVLLSVNGSSNFYRLRRTTFRAIPIENAQVGKELKPGQFVRPSYDFSNAVLKIDGEEYRYSASAPTGEYESCFTVEFMNIKKETHINQNANWYKDETGWVDGAKEQYGSLGNDVTSYHANYKATLYKGNIVPKSITIKSSLEGVQQVYAGTEITLTAELKGFDGVDYEIRWEAEKDGVRTVIPGINTLVYTFKLTEENSQYRYNVIVTPRN